MKATLDFPNKRNRNWSSQHLSGLPEAVFLLLVAFEACHSGNYLFLNTLIQKLSKTVYFWKCQLALLIHVYANTI
jgi:hypothetical protein